MESGEYYWSMLTTSPFAIFDLEKLQLATTGEHVS